MLDKTAARQTSAEFLGFLADIIGNQLPGKEIHVITANRSAHKTLQRAQLNTMELRVRFQGT